jgi:hypothetical protein
MLTANRYWTLVPNDKPKQNEQGIIIKKFPNDVQLTQSHLLWGCKTNIQQSACGLPAIKI